MCSVLLQTRTQGVKCQFFDIAFLEHVQPTQMYCMCECSCTVSLQYFRQLSPQRKAFQQCEEEGIFIIETFLQNFYISITVQFLKFNGSGCNDCEEKKKKSNKDYDTVDRYTFLSQEYRLFNILKFFNTAK